MHSWSSVMNWNIAGADDISQTHTSTHIDKRHYSMLRIPTKDMANNSRSTKWLNHTSNHVSTG